MSKIETAHSLTVDGLRLIDAGRMRATRSQKWRISFHLRRLCDDSGVAPHATDRGQTYLDCIGAIASGKDGGEWYARMVAEVVEEVYDDDWRRTLGINWERRNDPAASLLKKMREVSASLTRLEVPEEAIMSCLAAIADDEPALFFDINPVIDLGEAA